MKSATAIILSWLLIGVFPAFVLAPPASAATFTAASCSAADVLTAIGLASNGDTVLVPGGTCTWDTSTNKVTFTKQITLSGQGTTTINFNTNGVTATGTALDVTVGTSNNTFITGFAFHGIYINGACPITIRSTFSPLTLTWRFFSNTFSDSGAPQQGEMVCVTGVGPGLVDHNVFNNSKGANEDFHLLGDGPGNGTTWNTDVVPGNANNVFFEDNTWNSTATTDVSAIQGYYGARYVGRHNTLNGGFLADAHGAAPGARSVEWYQNTWILPSGGTYAQADLADFRAGWALVWGNHEQGTPCCNDPTPGLRFGPLNGSSDPQTGPWPISGQVGRGINQNYSPSYYWGNDTAITNKVGSANTNYVQIGTTINNCPGGGTAGHTTTCDVINAGSSQPGTIALCQSAADVLAGCPNNVPYTPFTYPHPLTGTVNFTLQPNPVPFGSQQISTQSASLTVTVSNTGTAAGTLGSPYYTLAGTNPGDFLNTGGTCSNGGSVPAGSNCTSLFAFKPTAAGARSATLTIAGITINLTGTGTAPAIPVVSLAPRVINFNTVNTGTTSSNQTVTLTNTGTATLTISSISDSSPSVFPMNSNTCGASLAPGAFCTFNVQFAPIIAGLQTATISISTNASTSPDTVSLSGTGFVVPVNTPPAPAVNLVATLKGINR